MADDDAASAERNSNPQKVNRHSMPSRKPYRRSRANCFPECSKPVPPKERAMPDDGAVERNLRVNRIALERAAQRNGGQNLPDLAPDLVVQTDRPVRP